MNMDTQLPSRPNRNIGAVVSAYHPDTRLIASVRALIPQVSRIVIVDDGPQVNDDETRQVLEKCHSLGCHVISHETNQGVAAALNTGISTLLHQPQQVDAVLTLDQDSQVPNNYIGTLTETWLTAEANNIQVGMVTPAKVTGIPHRFTRMTKRNLRIGSEPIQSGLLIPTSTFSTIGLFDESLFIDNVDSDFYLRALGKGLVCVVAPASIQHHLGHSRAVGFGPVRLDLTVADSFRYYYQTRNLVVMVRRYLRTNPRWVVVALLKEARHILVTSIFVPGRADRLRNAFSGLHDGFMNRMGPMAS